MCCSIPKTTKYFTSLTFKIHILYSHLGAIDTKTNAPLCQNPAEWGNVSNLCNPRFVPDLSDFPPREGEDNVTFTQYESFTRYAAVFFGDTGNPSRPVRVAG